MRKRKASLVWILIIIATFAVLAAFYASIVFILASWAGISPFTLESFLIWFLAFSILLGLVGVYMLIETATKEPDSWLGQLASGFFAASLIVMALFALGFAVQGLRLLVHTHENAVWLLIGAVAYAACFYGCSEEAKEAKKRVEMEERVEALTTVHKRRQAALAEFGERLARVSKDENLATILELYDEAQCLRNETIDGSRKWLNEVVESLAEILRRGNPPRQGSLNQ